MADEIDDERQWIVEPPPAAGEVSLFVALGEGVDLTPEQEAALGALLTSLEKHDAEVTGHASPACPKESTCIPLKCGKVSCSVLSCINLNRPKAVAQSAGWSLMGSFSPGPA
jgi:hypothetical protein